MAELALAWLLHQGDYVVPIPGTRNAPRVEENVAAVNLELLASDLDKIQEILPTGGFGARYAEGHLPNWV